MLNRPPLRNEQDGSPGGGSVPAAPASPAATIGTVQPAAPAVSPDAIKAVVGEALQGVVSELRNGIFADLRRAGVLKSEKPSPTAPAPAPIPIEAPAAPSVPSMTTADVQQLLAREGAFQRTVASAGLTEGQRETLEGLYRTVNPPDPHAWASDLIAKMGLGKSTPTASAAPEPTRPPPTPPAQNFSDKGPAASSTSRDPMAVLKHRAIEGTQSDFDRLVTDLGHDKALKVWNENMRAYLKGVRVKPGR